MTDIVTAEGKAFDAATGDWTHLITTKHVDLTRALDWIKFNRDWMKELRIVELAA